MQDAAPHPTWRRPVILTAAAIVVVLAPVLLWACYGATVFFETIRVGFVACFG